MSRSFLPRGLLVGVTLFCVGRIAAADPQPATELIVASDLLKLQQLNSPALSPDGKSVVYVVRSIAPKPDAKDDWTYQSHLWLAATDGATPPRRLTTAGRSNTAPTWHPDGRRIAFVRGGSAPGERAQIHLLSLAGGDAESITKLETGASNPRWSPDGRQLLFSSSLSYAEVRDALEKSGGASAPSWSAEKPGRATNDTANWKLQAAAKGKAAPDTATAKIAPVPAHSPDGSLAEIREWLARNEADGNPRVTSRYNFLAEGDLQADFSFAQLYVQSDAPNATARPLALTFEGKNGAEWMADSRHVIYVGARDEKENPDRVWGRNSLYLLDTVSGEKRVFLAGAEESYNNPTPSPDGKWVAYTLTTGGPFSFDQAKLAIQSTASGAPRVLTASVDRQVGNPQWTPDSRALYFTAPSEGRFPLYRVSLDSGDVQHLTWQPWGIRDFALRANLLVQIVTQPENPAELHTAQLSGKVSQPLTRHNADWLQGKKLSAYEAHSFVNAQGMGVDYWTMKPTNFDPAKKYPLLLNIHGGPTAMWGPGEESMWFEFQFYAARGYAIVFANPRGSGGYGHDFMRANYRDWGAGPASDVLTAATEAAQQPFVDAERQVVTGGSYGGYLTAWIVAHDHRFKAAVAQRGVYDLIPFFGEGNAWGLVPRYWGGYHWEPEVRAELLRDSPFTYAHQIKTPLLIKHGEVDFRTGVIQSQMLYKTLKALGRDVEYVRYPRATHELSRSGEPKQRLDRLVRYEEFFRRYIGEN
ncbi:MAG: S9 family peptidase [Candidatus Didemnitutus sp.]|nr:S9 family peptidase [Candidatus Didemnitutus sp.]